MFLINFDLVSEREAEMRDYNYKDTQMIDPQTVNFIVKSKVTWFGSYQMQ